MAQCSEKVYRGGYAHDPYSACLHNATVERDGKHYCAQHDPEVVRARIEAHEAKYQKTYKDTKVEAERVMSCIRAFEGVAEPEKALTALVTAARTLLEQNSNDWTSIETQGSLRAALRLFEKEEKFPQSAITKEE